MKKLLLQRKFSLFYLLLCIAAGNAYGQTAITAVNSSYLTSTNGLSYSATGAAGSPLAGNTYLYKYGNLSGTASNNLQLNNFTAGGNVYRFAAIPNQFVKIRRVNNAVVTGIRNLRYSEGNIAGSTLNIAPDYNDSMEVFFNGNTAFNSGSDNLFANQGDGNGNNNNIERLDVIFPNGVSASDNTKLGFSIFERGDVNAHDPVKVAVILSVDASGNPTGYSGIISLTAAGFGTVNPVAALNYVIFRRDTAVENRLKISTTVNQGIGGVFIKLSDFGIANNTTFYGYSVIPNDFTGSTSAQILNYTNAALYPVNSSSATGSGGIDLVSATGAFLSGSVLNNSISGTVFNDVNGLSNSLLDGIGTHAGGVNAILVNSSGNVAATTAVAADGTYSFAGVFPGTYSIVLSTSIGSIGLVAPAPTLPAGWVNTGEGITTAGDGNVNGQTNTFNLTTANISNVNFGIEQPATAGNLSAASQVNPGGAVSVTVPAATFSGTDVSGGTIGSLSISTFPSNATSITINGTSYTGATFPGAGVTVPTNAAGQPTQTISVDPVNGAVTVVIPYFVTDNAGKISAAAGTANVPFTALTVNGNVFNDVNGLTNNLVDGTGTNGGGVNAILIDGSGNVTGSVAVAAGGAYSILNVSAGTYSVRLSTTAGIIGAAAPAASLPAGWVNTGEGITTAGDGNVNGQTNTFNLTTANISNVNFGIEQPATAGNLSAASQVNPGGAVSVTVPAATFSGTDVSGGTIGSLSISTFPSNATSITINGTSYTGATFPGAGVTVPTNAAGQPTQTISVDPVNGAVTVVIPYFVTDNAGKTSAIAGSASLPFFCAIPGLWTGAVSTDWSNPANWCSNTVPISTTDVVVPSGVANMPFTSAAVVINNLNLQPGTVLNIFGDAFTMNGVITGTGTFSTASSSSLTIGGNGGGNAGTVNFTNGNNTLGSFTLSRSGASASAALGSAVRITDVLTVTNGALNSNDNITLASTAAGTARVSAINCNVAAVNGNVTVERYITARRAWRMLSVPVAGSQTIKQSWQENAASATDNPAPGYGTHITGGTAANGFDQTQTNNAGIRIFNPALLSFTATPLAATTLPLNNQTGYFLFVRGNRSTDLSINSPVATATILRTKGPLKTCTQTQTTVLGVCSLVGNPYASAIDFTLLTRTNIPNRFFLWDPYLNAVGGYQTFDADNGFIPSPGGGSYGSTANSLIQQGQAFFVQGTIGAGSLVINENAKVSGSNNFGFRPLNQLQKFSVKLHTVNNNISITLNDGTLAIFDNDYAAGTDNEDARKMTNVDEMVCLIRDNKLLSIEKRPVITAADTLFVKAYNLKIKNYRLITDPVNMDAALTAYLEDNFLNTATALSLSASSVINFSVTADAASSSSGRFRIVFKPTVVLPVKLISIKATALKNNVEVSWEAETEMNVYHYDIEKSVDGRQFTAAATIQPALNNNSTAAYTWIDDNIQQGYNYYRIKITETTGAIRYSIVVNAKMSEQPTVLNVYPNPVTGNKIFYEIKNLPPGKYAVELYNEAGQVLQSAIIRHTGGHLKTNLYAGKILYTGSYRLVVKNEYRQFTQLIKQH